VLLGQRKHAADMAIKDMKPEKGDIPFPGKGKGRRKGKKLGT
jgi:hypothetical protein